MTLLDRLRGGLIVSVQAWPGSAIDDANVLAAMAAAAAANGAAGVRMQGVANLAAARPRVGVPVIGIVKREYPGFEPYITPTPDEVRAVAAAGADVIAFDATARPRPHGCSVADVVREIVACGCAPMADCANVEDARAALAEGVPIVATTLHGYTKETKGAPLPALALVREMTVLGNDAQRRPFVVCEGGIQAPDGVAAAFGAGADAVVVGTAITNIDWLVREFAARAPKTGRREA
jgi:N-acylglucosamine-6-phosphate 2-epimerase